MVKERRGVTPDTALRLARLFSTTLEFWLNLQCDHDLSKARAEVGVQARKLVHPLEA